MASRRLEVLLVGKDAGGTAVLDKLGTKSKEAEGKTKSLGTTTSAAMLLGGAAVLKFGKTAVDEYQRIGTETIKLQRYLGGTPEEMSRLRFAAQQSGVDVDAFTKSLGKASKTLADSKNPMKDFGFATRDASGEMRPMTDVLLDVADKLETMPAGAERTAYAMKVFGKSGAEVIPFLSKGRDGIEELMAKTDEYGLVLSGSNLQAIKDNKQAQRELTAAMDGLQVKIGSAVLPMLTSFTHGLASIPGPVSDVIGPLLGVGGAALGMVIAYQKLGAFIGPVNSALKGNATGLRGVTSGAAGATAAIGLMVVGYEMWAKRMEDADNKAKSLTEVGDKAVQQVSDWGELASRIDVARNATGDFLTQAASAKSPLDLDWSLEMLKGAKATAEQTVNLQKLQVETTNYARDHHVSNEVALAAVQAGHEEKRATEEAAAARAEATAGMSDMEVQQYDLNEAVKESEKAYTEAAKKVKDFWDPGYDIGEAEIKASQAHEDLRQALIKNGTSLDLSTEAGRKNREEFMESTRAATDYGLAILKNGGTVEEATTATNGHIEGLKQQMLQAGFSQTAVDMYVTSLKLTPADVKTQFETEGLAQANVDATTFANTIDRIRAVRVAANFAGGVAAIAGHAKGGGVADGWFMVGEEGPELGHKSGNSVQIIPNNKLKGYAGGTMHEDSPGWDWRTMGNGLGPGGRTAAQYDADEWAGAAYAAEMAKKNSYVGKIEAAAPGGLTVNIYNAGSVVTVDSLADDLETAWRQKARSGTGILATNP